MASDGNGDDGARLAEIEARAKAATPGPWDYEPQEYEGDEPISGAWVKQWKQDLGDGYHTMTDADARFCAHARADVPWLLARVRRLEAEAKEASRIPNLQGQELLAARESVRRLEAEAAELRRAAGEGERNALKELKARMERSIGNCCEGGAGTRFCENYGCGTLKRYLEIIDAALAASAGAGAKGGEGGGE